MWRKWPTSKAMGPRCYRPPRNPTPTFIEKLTAIGDPRIRRRIPESLSVDSAIGVLPIERHDARPYRSNSPYALRVARGVPSYPAAQSAAHPRKFPGLCSSRATAPGPHHPEDNGHDDENDPDQEQEIADLVDVESRTMHGDSESQDGSDDHKNDPQQHQADA